MIVMIAETDILARSYFLSCKVLSGMNPIGRDNRKKEFIDRDSIWIRQLRNDHGFRRRLFTVVALSLRTT